MSNIEVTLVSSENNAPTIPSDGSQGVAAGNAAISARLIGIQCTFDTTDDDKDGDTSVDVQITNNAVVIGQGNVGGGDHWDDGARRVINIPVVNAIDWTQGGVGTVNINMRPNGDDEWHFNLTILMTYEFGGSYNVGWTGFNLAEDRSSQSGSWT